MADTVREVLREAMSRWDGGSAVNGDPGGAAG
jgi:hypothetical protein